ncbi:GH92 family glycosyl hydrolase [Streptomyces sp. NPDC054784]
MSPVTPTTPPGAPEPAPPSARRGRYGPFGRTVRRGRAGALAPAVALLTLAAGTPALASAPAAAPEAARLAEDPAQYVDPMIGTSNAGNAYPGAVRPYGMLSWSPQTSKGQQNKNPAPGGYQYDATKIRGFSLTHLSGVGCSGASGDIPIMPHVGAVDSSPSADTSDEKYASTFSHENEEARPGYYKVGLDSGAGVELTATERTGSGRFTFPEDKAASLLFRTSNSETGSTAADVKVDKERRTVSGSVEAGNFCGPQSENNRHRMYKLHFTARFDQPFAETGGWRDGDLEPGATSASGGTGYNEDGDARAGKGSGAYVTFDEGVGEVGARVAVSYVSEAGAEANLAAENPEGTDFGKVAEEATADWNEELGRIEVGGDDEKRLTTFYTALYHSMLEPTVANDVDGNYTGADEKTHRLSEGQERQFGTFSGWDQYRAQVQLMAWLSPKAASDYAQSLYNFAGQRDGEWDRWLLHHAKTSVMSGDPSAVALAGMHAFGADDFDVRGAVDSLVRAAKEPTANDSSDDGCPVECVGQRPALDFYLDKGYVPADDCHCWGGAAETLEDAAADFGLAELTGRLGDEANAKDFLRRSGNWANVFDPDATDDGGYMRDRKRDGSWAGDSFDPATGEGFVEGSSARYTWMVYSDVAGLTEKMGGKERAEERLDAFFRTPDGKFDFSAEDDTRYDPTNEPDINAPYLYNYLGTPAKTQETVRAELDQLWTTGHGGIPGNDDAGTMSAWYVFSALGVYPQVPSRADLVLSAPVFPTAVVHGGNGNTLRINAPEAADGAAYIAGVRVDGEDSDRTWVPGSLVTEGGTLDYTLADRAGDWGTGADSAPPSFPPGG